MKGGLRIDNASGERWDLALDMIEGGRDFVMLGDELQVSRHVGWPGADGHIHFAVLAGTQVPSRGTAQRQIDKARNQVARLAEADARFDSLVKAYGDVWEYAGDDGSATWRIASVSEDGSLLWPEQ